MRAAGLFLCALVSCAAAPAERGAAEPLVLARAPLAAIASSDPAAEPAPRPPAAQSPGIPSPSSSATSASPATIATIAPAPARITSVGRVTWIWPKPSMLGRFLGYVRVGRSVALTSATLVPGQGCAGGFYAVEPRGYVCADRTVTLEPDARRLDASIWTAPEDRPLPYRYAISSGAPMYNRVPSVAEQDRFERTLGPANVHPSLPRTLAAHEDLAVREAIVASDPLPASLAAGEVVAEGRIGLLARIIPRGSMLSYTKSYDVGGRVFLLSTDETLVPADRVRAFRPSTFEGVRLGAELSLPIAWARERDRPAWRRDGETMVDVGEPFRARSHVALSGQSLELAGKEWLETLAHTDDGAPLYIAAADATVARREAKRPIGVAQGQKWVIVKLTQGTLVAYEDDQPVYATLVSPGAGGVPSPGVDPVKASTTPLGVYYLTFKDRAATMSPDKDPENRTFWIADVPYTQYFNPPFALHAAYWHERFGEPTSAGCINLSPIDAKALFEWTDPPVPEGWQGATGAGAPLNGPNTAVVVRR